jgi:hypothetical protein
MPRTNPSQPLIRAMLASGLGQFEFGPGHIEKIARRLWPKDEQTLAVVKAATAPADTTTSGWASQLATSSIADLVMTMGPTYAGGDLMKRAMALEFGRSAQVNAPGIVSGAIGATAWIAQGAPIPVRQFSVGSGATLTPRKTAASFVVTREVLEHSTPNAEKFIRAAATEAVGAEIDSAMFDAAAASTTRPAGLRNGVTTTTATAGGGDLAMMRDLGALAQAVAPVGGMNLVFVAAPGEAVKIALRAGPEFKFPVLASGGLAAGFVMCIALPALVSAIDPAVRFEASKEATLHMEDTTPLAIGTAGTPNTIAAPVRSLFQTDCVGFKLLLEVSWGLRAANAVSWTSAVSW